MNVKTLTLLVLIVLLVVIVVPLQGKKIIKDVYMPEELPAVGSPPSFMMARKNNTLEQRPGTKYEVIVYPDADVPPSYEMRLLYTPSCNKHQLVMLFETLAKQYLSDGTAAQSNISFTREIVDVTLPVNANQTYPKVLKIRRNGQVLEYKGLTDYGALNDFILNEAQLF